MKNGRITKRAVDKMKAKKGKETRLWDGKLGGFGVRLRPTTGRKYYFVKLYAGKRQRWITIGEHGAPWTAESARSEAMRLLGIREDGVDPAAERDSLKQNPTVEELGAMFIEQHVKTKLATNSQREAIRLFDTCIKPKLGKTQVL